MDNIQAYPLQWPETVPRMSAHQRTKSKFGVRSLALALDEIKAEVRRAGGIYLTVSTNIVLRNDGFPRSGQRTPEDPGVAIYFQRKGKSICLPCDRWKSVEENLHAIALHLAAMRGQERWGIPDAVDRAFEGYAMLPSQAEATWRQVLEISDTAGQEQAEAAYKALVKIHHPDKGGQPEKMAQLNDAIQQARQYYGKE